MGTCCEVCLANMVYAYARNAENGAVTVKPIENPLANNTCSCIIGSTRTASNGTLPAGEPVYCCNPARFVVSYYPKKEFHLQREDVTDDTNDSVRKAIVNRQVP